MVLRTCFYYICVHCERELNILNPFVPLLLWLGYCSVKQLGNPLEDQVCTYDLYCLLISMTNLFAYCEYRLDNVCRFEKATQ